MLCMIFLIGGNYNLLKILKDTVLISTAGAVAIPFVKVWFLMPSAVLLTAAYVKLSQVLSPNKVFYSFLSFFYFFYIIFFVWMFPAREGLYAHHLADYLQTILPIGAKGLVDSIRYWPIVLFYPFCELWGTMIQFVLFWGFVNRITKIGQAKRFYPLFGFATNLSGIIVSSVYYMVSKYNERMDNIMSFVIVLLTLSIGLIFILFYNLTKNIQEQKEVGAQHLEDRKNKLTLIGALRNLFKDAYVRNLTFIVLSYNIVINLTEILWKKSLETMYNNNDVPIGEVLAQVMLITSALACLSDLLICGPVIRSRNLTKSALVTPIILTITSIFFIPLVVFPSLGIKISPWLGVTPIALTVFFGSLQNALSRASKYSFFDTSKELAFLPLSVELKTNAKATIDGVGSRLGKSLGSLSYQVLSITLGGVTAGLPIITGLIATILFFWIRSAKSLGEKFNLLSHNSPIEPPSFANADQMGSDDVSSKNILKAKSVNAGKTVEVGLR